MCFEKWLRLLLTEPSELHEQLNDDTGRRIPDNITGLEAMLNPNMEELAQIDNETLEVILKTDRNDETSPTSRTFFVESVVFSCI